MQENSVPSREKGRGPVVSSHFNNAVVLIPLEGWRNDLQLN
jgi:hypothetical protein